jgi:hypothetical protein
VNTKLWVCVIVGVLVAHLCVLVIVDKIRKPQKPAPQLVEPNFSVSTATVSAPDGKVLKMEHEFTVETQFAKPEVLAKLPPPPAPYGAPPETIPAPAPAN